MRRTPDARPFRAALGRAVRGVFRRYATLGNARVAVSRQPPAGGGRAHQQPLRSSALEDRSYLRGAP